MSRHTEKLDDAYHGAKNSTSISGALPIESSNVAEVSFTTSEGVSTVSPSAKTQDARTRANAGERSVERRMTVGGKNSEVPQVTGLVIYITEAMD
jgi:hypothetical protein